MTLTQAYALSAHPPLSRLPLRATLTVVTWDMRRRTRRDLRALSGHMLQDIGLDPHVAATEVAKPFWQA